MDRFDLAGAWELSLAGGKSPVSLPESVTMDIPGDNITALLKADLVPDPFYGRNELELQWIGRCDWRIRRSFDVDSGMAAAGAHYFTADSLDTIAEVAINGVPVVSSSNMFHRIRVELPTGLLKAGENTIEIVFRSPEIAAALEAAQLPYPIPHSSYPVQSPHRNLIRKVQCHSGWDWGPSLMVSGVNGAICIEATDAGLIDYIPTRTTREEGVWTLAVEPILQLTREADARTHTVSARLLAPDGAVVGAGESVLSGRQHQAEPIRFTVNEPELWWPAGEGGQPLYTLEVEALGDTLRTRVGFRTIELRRQPDEHGSEFTFVVNDRPVFARGANWIPQSALPGLATHEELVDLLQSAVDANMNMIRVWGGGTYESDRFYELCDELGLLVWQDFMFSCSLYPSTADFLRSVRQEVRHQVLRLTNHPSIALWCGNNEDLGALNWFEESRAHRDRYVVDYDRLNEGAIGATVRELDPGRILWPSSPAAGPDDYSDNWTADASGDMHYWSVWHSGEPFAAYRSVVPRFCSEFGFQSFPSPASVATYATPDQYNVTSPDMEHHQRHPNGNTVIMHTMARYFRFPATFDQQLYLSQVQQSLAIQTAVEYWRSRRPRCMGALYWQLNDTWPVASWSSIEFGGQWKLLHYAARRFFDQIMVTAVPVDSSGVPLANENGIAAAWRIYVVNDTATAITGRVTLRIHRFDGSSVIERQVPAEPGPGASVHCMTLESDDLGAALHEVFGYLSFESDGHDTRTNSFFLTEPKRCDLPKPSISAVVQTATRETTASLQTDCPAFYVALSLQGVPGRFSDNLLCLMPGTPTTVRIKTSLEPGRIGEALQVMNLADIGRE